MLRVETNLGYVFKKRTSNSTELGLAEFRELPAFHGASAVPRITTLH